MGTRSSSPGSSVLIALDPSPNNTGIAILGYQAMGSQAEDPIVIKTIRQGKDDEHLDEKAAKAMAQVHQLIQDHQPDLIVCEKVASVGYGKWGQTSYGSTSALTKIEGMAQLLAAIHGLPLALLTPTKWKAAYGIKGERQKEQAINIATQYSGIHYSTFDEHSAEAYLMGFYAIRHIALPLIDQLRIF